MTRERDIEHVLEAWLAPGPREAPDRVLLAITDRIDHVPQRRFPSINERFHHMTPILKLTAAAVLAIAVGVAVGPHLVSSDIFGQPTPTPSPSPTLSALPVELLGTWLSEERDLYADYRHYIGEPPRRVVRLWLIAVSLFQRRRGRASFRDFVFEDGGGRRLEVG